MKPSGLQLKRYTYPESRLDSFQKGEELPDLPTVQLNAFAVSVTSIHVSVKVTWGEEKKHKYFIDIVSFGSFELPQPGQADQKDVKGYLERNLRPLAVNGAQILLGAIRERIFSLTLSGPFGARYMPALFLGEEDIEIYLSNELDRILNAKEKKKSSNSVKRERKTKSND